MTKDQPNEEDHNQHNDSDLLPFDPDFHGGDAKPVISNLPQLKCHFLPPSYYMKPSDLDFCLEKTDFSEEEILQWFRKFRSSR